MKRFRISGNFISGIGIIFLLCSFVLMVYNLWDTNRAQQESANLASQLEAYMEDAAETVDATIDPETPMPEVEIDGISYIGRLEISSLGLNLPVVSEWSYDYLKMAPCRYSGSAYNNDMVIAAHNYKRHFGDLRWQQIGTEIKFIDMNSNSFLFEIAEIEVLEPIQVEEMQHSVYDLTLFTCDYSGRARYAIRCNRIEQ